MTYQVTDFTGQTATSTLTPVVPPPPVAVNDTSTGNWDTNQTITPLTNDIPGDASAPLVASTLKLCQVDDPATTPTNEAQSPNNCTATTVVVPGEGTYTLNTDGTVTFDPLDTFTGTATTIRYQVADTLGQITTATITVEVSPPPTADPDTSTGPFDTNQTITPLANDEPGDEDAPLVASTLKLCGAGQTVPDCTATTVVVAGEGTYTLNADGTVTFDPLDTFTGTATPITYQVADTLGQVASSTITVTVTPPPPPTALNDTSTGPFDTNQTITPLANDAGGVAGAPLVASTLKLCGSGETAPTCTATTITVANQGTYTLNADGTVTFDPLPTFTGTATPITYQVTDTLGRTVNATITPTVTPPPLPTAANDTSIDSWDTNQTITPLANDAGGAIGAPLVASTLKLCQVDDPATTPTNEAQSPDNCTATTVVVAGEGTYTLNADGTVTFDPLSTFTGTATPITYQVTDTLGRTVNATITPTVLPPPAPTATPETKLVLPGQQVSFTTVIGTDGLATGAGLQTGSTNGPCLVDPVTNTCGTTVTIAGEGTWTIDQITGIATFTADAEITVGTKTAITYRVTDMTGQTATSTLTPIVPTPPSATNDVSSGPYDTDQTIRPLSNDSFDSLTPAQVSSLRLCQVDDPDTEDNESETPNNCTATQVVIEGEGVYTLNADGTVTFNPDANFTGTVRTPVTYQVTDSLGRTVYATITPTVAPPGAPVATPDTEMVLPGSAANFPTITGTGGLATGTGLVTSGTGATCLLLPGTTDCASNNEVTIAGEGTFTLDPSTGIVTYLADASATSGTKTSVDYRVTDLAGQTATSTLTPIVPPPPSATDDVSSDTQDINQLIRLFTNDSFNSLAPADNATLFLCAIDDPETEDTDESEEPNNCTLTSLTVPGEGTYTVNSDGTVTFDPLPNFIGTATPVRYQAQNTIGNYVTALITPTVTPRPVAPAPSTNEESPESAQGWVVDQVTSTSPGVPVMLDPKNLGSPTPGHTFVDSTLRIWNAQSNTWSSSATTADGKWEVMGDQVRFTPRKGFLGVAVVPFSITDTSGIVMGAMLTVDIADGIQVLPATGPRAMSRLAMAIILLVAGAWITRRRRAVGRSDAPTTASV